MRARIYQPAKTAMQSGTAKTHHWVLEFAPASGREVDPLMGWTSSSDTQAQVRLRFDSREAAEAYAAAKGKVKGKKDFSDDYVSKAEFRYLLIYLKLYYHLWIEFDSIDKTGDRRISEAEFVAGQPILAKWGVCNSKVEAIFADLLKKNNAEGHITFTQFCDWAIGEHLRQHTDCDDHNSLG